MTYHEHNNIISALSKILVEKIYAVCSKISFGLRKIITAATSYTFSKNNLLFSTFIFDFRLVKDIVITNPDENKITVALITWRQVQRNSNYCRRRIYA
jgi:hypothetical protein